MKRITIAALTIIMVLLLASCVSAQSDKPEQKETVEFGYVHDWAEPKTPEGMNRILEEQAANTHESEPEAPQDEVYTEEVTYYEEAYYEPYSGSDGFMFEGVRDFNGRTETWYSSNQAYHYRTSEWTVDDEGYYRDSEGRYIVAASDVPEGTEIETSKGTGIVSDSGCDDGVTDFYVAW